MLTSPRPVYDPTTRHEYDGSGGGTRNTATAFAKAAVPAAPAPAPAPAPAGVIPWIMWRPRWPPYTFGQRWRLSRSRERPVLKYVCVCLSALQYFVRFR